MKALIVDDDVEMRELLRLVADGAGLETTTCDSAEDALPLVEAAGAFDLVILDWGLPGIDGVELCRRIRAQHGERWPYVLLVTARASADDLATVLAAGADDYLPKPIEPSVLSVRLAIAMGAARVARERVQIGRELEATLARVARAHENLVHVLNQLRTGTVIIGADGAVRFVSRAAAATLGRDVPALVGRPWREVFRLPHADLDRLARLVTMPADQRTPTTLRIDRPDGRTRDVTIEIFDDPREPGGLVYAIEDDTEVEDLRRILSDRASFHDLVGASREMVSVYEQIRDVASVDWTVLIEGDTGTGKELVARAIHGESARRDGPFVAVNCASLSVSLLQSQLFGHRRGAFTGAISDQPGYFEAASGGTLFLDEIGDITREVQMSLLRVLEEGAITRVGESHARRVDVRVITATHRDLANEVERGNFRADLMYRIRVARITLPPLRERRGDIPLLANRFLDRARAVSGRGVSGFSDAALSVLLEHTWPGNVRELRSAVEYAVIRARGPRIEVCDLPRELHAITPRASTLLAAPGASDVASIRAALDKTGGNRTRAARLLGVSRATFYRRLAELGFDR